MTLINKLVTTEEVTFGNIRVDEVTTDMVVESMNEDIEEIQNFMSKERQLFLVIKNVTIENFTDEQLDNIATKNGYDYYVLKDMSTESFKSVLSATKSFFKTYYKRVLAFIKKWIAKFSVLLSKSNSKKDNKETLALLNKLRISSTDVVNTKDNSKFSKLLTYSETLENVLPTLLSRKMVKLEFSSLKGTKNKKEVIKYILDNTFKATYDGTLNIYVSGETTGDSPILAQAKIVAIKDKIKLVDLGFDIENLRKYLRIDKKEAMGIVNYKYDEYISVIGGYKKDIEEATNEDDMIRAREELSLHMSYLMKNFTVVSFKLRESLGTAKYLLKDIYKVKANGSETDDEFTESPEDIKIKETYSRDIDEIKDCVRSKINGEDPGMASYDFRIIQEVKEASTNNNVDLLIDTYKTLISNLGSNTNIKTASNLLTLVNLLIKTGLHKNKELVDFVSKSMTFGLPVETELYVLKPTKYIDDKNVTYTRNAIIMFIKKINNVLYSGDSEIEPFEIDKDEKLLNNLRRKFKAQVSPSVIMKTSLSKIFYLGAYGSTTTLDKNKIDKIIKIMRQNVDTIKFDIRDCLQGISEDSPHYTFDSEDENHLRRTYEEEQQLDDEEILVDEATARKARYERILQECTGSLKSHFKEMGELPRGDISEEVFESLAKRYAKVKNIIDSNIADIEREYESIDNGYYKTTRGILIGLIILSNAIDASSKFSLSATMSILRSYQNKYMEVDEIKEEGENTDKPKNIVDVIYKEIKSLKPDGSITPEKIESVTRLLLEVLDFLSKMNMFKELSWNSKGKLHINSSMILKDILKSKDLSEPYSVEKYLKSTFERLNAENKLWLFTGHTESTDRFSLFLKIFNTINLVDDTIIYKISKLGKIKNYVVIKMALARGTNVSLASKLKAIIDSNSKTIKVLAKSIDNNTREDAEGLLNLFEDTIEGDKIRSSEEEEVLSNSEKAEIVLLSNIEPFVKALKSLMKDNDYRNSVDMIPKVLKAKVNTAYPDRDTINNNIYKIIRLSPDVDKDVLRNNPEYSSVQSLTKVIDDIIDNSEYGESFREKVNSIKYTGTEIANKAMLPIKVMVLLSSGFLDLEKSKVIGEDDDLTVEVSNIYDYLTKANQSNIVSKGVESNKNRIFKLYPDNVLESKIKEILSKGIVGTTASELVISKLNNGGTTILSRVKNHMNTLFRAISTYSTIMELNGDKELDGLKTRLHRVVNELLSISVADYNKETMDRLENDIVDISNGLSSSI